MVSFGSIDGDSAAAIPRYYEDPSGENRHELMADLEKGGGLRGPTMTWYGKIPDVMPTKFRICW